MVFLVLAALFAYRPAPVLGVKANALAFSVPLFEAKCSQTEGDRWRCRGSLSTSSASRPSARTYEVNGLGCWEQVEPPRPEGRGRGCMTLFDYL